MDFLSLFLFRPKIFINITSDVFHCHSPGNISLNAAHPLQWSAVHRKWKWYNWVWRKRGDGLHKIRRHVDRENAFEMHNNTRCLECITSPKTHFNTRWKQALSLAHSISGILYLICGRKGATINMQENPGPSGRGGMPVICTFKVLIL